ncbi:unnamed protein product [Cylicocyclus nassatus]|uniref:Uncharacterized protein n=1 Tax=Cylicocyclus nassatus TaxID=53992 RepID=A0AA36GQY6_CYLNA|nr:unnamed protein product [Cylicocyclus nassatus]
MLMYCIVIVTASADVPALASTLRLTKEIKEQNAAGQKPEVSGVVGVAISLCLWYEEQSESTESMFSGKRHARSRHGTTI